MRKIIVDSSKIKLLATILLNGAKAEKGFFYIAEIEDMPQDYLQMLWPGCKDSDIISEFKNLVYAEDFAEFEINYPGRNPYLAYAKIVRRSWVTKHVAKMMKNGLIDKGEEAEVRDMFDIISMNNRNLARHFFETFERYCDKEAEEFLKAINEMSVRCKSVPLETRQNPAQNP